MLSHRLSLQVTSDFSVKCSVQSLIQVVLHRCLGMMKMIFSLEAALALCSAPGRGLVWSALVTDVRRSEPRPVLRAAGHWFLICAFSVPHRGLALNN